MSTTTPGFPPPCGRPRSADAAPTRRCTAGFRTTASGSPFTYDPTDDESGHGLLIVTVLADRWGSEPYPPGGKTVWAERAC